MVNFLELEAVEPVYSRVPVLLPLEPKITLLALLPNGPLELASLIVPVLSVPLATVSWPEKVFVPERVRVPVEPFMRLPEPAIVPEIVRAVEPVTSISPLPPAVRVKPLVQVSPLPV